MITIQNVNDAILYLKNMNIYWSPQIETINNNVNTDFMSYLYSISEYSRVDYLDCLKSWSRQKSHKNVEDVLPFIENSTKCGIKIITTPVFKLSEWEKWENGYIEGFCCFDIIDPTIRITYFIWLYIKIGRLEEIIYKWGNELKILGNYHERT